MPDNYLSLSKLVVDTKEIFIKDSELTEKVNEMKTVQDGKMNKFVNMISESGDIKVYVGNINPSSSDFVKEDIDDNSIYIFVDTSEEA